MKETYYDILRSRDGEDRAFAQVMHDAVALLEVVGVYGGLKMVARTPESLDAIASDAKILWSVLQDKTPPKYEDIIAALNNYEHLGERYAAASSIRKCLEDAVGTMREFAERKVA